MPLVFVNLLQYTGTKGGIEVYIRELYNALKHIESEFEFIGFASDELARQGAPWFPGRIINSGISGEIRVAWAIGELFAVSKVAKSVGADIIHGPAMLGPLWPKVPFVLTVHDLLYFTHPHLMKTKAFTAPVKWMEKRAAARAERIIAISEVTAAAVRQYLKFDRSKIDVIVQAGRVNSLGDREIVREADLFIAVGQRSPYKGFETAVRAWAEIPTERRPRLVITGSHGEDPLIPLVRELGLEDSVELKSWIPTEELNTLFATATALIDPTLAAGSSLPTLEAMNIGLPVLLSDTPVFREVGADAADYFTVQSPTDLARAVIRLSDNPHRLAELSGLGRERAKHFSWDRVATQTLESFRKALETS